MKKARYLTFGVPVNNADIDYGDENIHPSNYWNKLIKKALGEKVLIKVYPLGHKNKFFLLLRKIIPYYKETSKYSSLMNKINNLLFRFEVNISSFNLYVIDIGKIND